MAGEWLKFEKSTLDKPEVLAVAAALQCDPDLVVGKFMRMWAWFDTHTVDGNARSVTPALLESILRVTGFVTEAAKVGWLVVTDGGISLPNFDKHCGETAKQRALTARRVAGFKAANAKGNATVTDEALPREEKRREEKKDQKPPIVPHPGDASSAASDNAAILDSYHAILPACQRIEVLNPKRRKRLAAAVKLAKQVCASQGWEYVPDQFWPAYWTQCAADKWMRGEVPNPNNPAWKQNLDVLLAEDRFASVMDKAIAAMRGGA